MRTTGVLNNEEFGRVSHVDWELWNLPGISELEILARSYSFQEVERLAAGKRAVWSATNWEAPLILACKTLPVSLAYLWRDRSIEAEAVGERHFQVPAEFCSMIKAGIGRFHLLRNNPIKKILYFGSTCEAINTIMELAKEDAYDAHCIENITAFKPEDKSPEVIKFFAEELQEVARWLTGKPVNEEALTAEIRRKNSVLHKVRRILELRVKNPLCLTSIPTLWMLLGSNHYFGRPEEYIRVLDTLIEGLESTPRKPESDGCLPLVFSGFGIGTGLLNVIEESRAAIVGWELMGTGTYREDIPPLESMAHYVLDAQSRGELGPGAGASATARCRHIEELVQQSGARGIVSSSIIGCPYGSISQQVERDYFKALGIPIITLESTVHPERPTEEQVMRVKTFVEMLS